MTKKLNFQSVVSLVIGSQIGSGAFLIPASLALLGPISLFGWLISGAGAIFLALVFGQLSLTISKGGGPHSYVEQAFGRPAAFFTAWTYWVISWVSSIAVIIAAIGYLSPLMGLSHPLAILSLEILIFTLITLLNMCGATIAGFCEIFLTLAKCTPLVLIPLFAFFSFHTDYFFPLNPNHLPTLSTLNTATLMTFWGFVGLETATTTSSLIHNPAKTIPRAILTGTLLVATIYLLNSFSIMGILPPATLSTTQAPYADAAHILFGGSWTLPMTLLAFIVCVGTLNAWVLTSGQIALEAARAHLFPTLFSRTTRTGAPYISLLISYLCTLPLLVLTLTPNILTQLNFIIDLSVTAFVFIYLACTLAYLTFRPSPAYTLIALLAAAFCLWILLFTSLLNLLLCTLFILSGLPIYLYQKRTLAQQPNP